MWYVLSIICPNVLIEEDPDDGITNFPYKLTITDAKKVFEGTTSSNPYEIKIH